MSNVVEAYYGFDSYGLCIGIFAFVFALLISYFLIRAHDLNRRAITLMLIASSIGHFVGAYAYYLFTLKYGSDSFFYFNNANDRFEGFGYSFAFFVIWYARFFLLENSLLGAFFVSGAIGVIGSVYYLLAYTVLLQRISPKKLYLYDSKQLLIPSFLLLCWPSYFFWSAALVKDNFAFLSIAIILFTFAKAKLDIIAIAQLAVASFLAFMVRPYLFIIFISSIILYLIMGSKIKPGMKLIYFILIVFLTLYVTPYLNSYMSVIHFSGSLSNVGKYAIQQQKYMSIGTSLPMPTEDPKLIFLFVPYLLLGNLLLPLGYGASNLISVISSIENALLAYLIFLFIKYRVEWKLLVQSVSIGRFFLIYFFVGMSCLSLMSTNLGLAMREKMMYVPALLICIFLTYAHHRSVSKLRYV